ncbi:DM13 domain-containing protein [Candidatus Saccharibacteria bacterium]|nr:DM13 domain-containing protein [Candidatus Saccharibacteria bacterium]
MKKIILLAVVVIAVGGGIFAIKNITEKTETVDQSTVAESIDTKNSGAATLKQGDFIAIDGFHKGSGTAQIIKTDQGNIVKFGDDFSVTNGPDLFVYFSKTADENDKNPGDFVSLGKLQKTSGEQTYKLPDNIEEYKSVVIWCRAFKTTFSLAPLR